jgi:hypothetical protein
MSTGYHIYSNTGAGDPINYASPTATVSALTHLDVVYSLLLGPRETSEPISSELAEPLVRVREAVGERRVH